MSGGRPGSPRVTQTPGAPAAATDLAKTGRIFPNPGQYSEFPEKLD
jgi:hypothetical protein